MNICNKPMKMKRVLNLLTISFVLSIMSCSMGNTPENVAVEFMEAFHSFNFDKAMELCTNDTKGAMARQKEFLERGQEKESLEITKPKVSFVESEWAEDGESAVVRVTVENSILMPKNKNADRLPEIRVDLVKEDGKWRVVFRGK